MKTVLLKKIFIHSLIFLSLSVDYELFALQDITTRPESIFKNIELERKKASYISIVVLFNSQLTERNWFNVIDSIRYDDIKDFGWFQGWPISHEKFQKFKQDLYRIDSSSCREINVTDLITVRFIELGEIKESICFSDAKNINKYIGLIKENFGNAYGIPEEMIKKYDSMK